MKRIKTRDPHIFDATNGVKYYRRNGIEKSLGRVTQFEAEKRKEGIEAKIDVFGRQATRVRIRDVYHEFMESRRLDVYTKDIRPATYEETEILFEKHLLGFFGKYKFIDINEKLWDKYVIAKSDIDLSNHRKVFGFFMRWAKRQQYTRYALDMKIPTRNRRKLKVVPSEDIKKILSNADGSLLLFLSCYLFMGVRRKEIMTLEWSRVDLLSGVMALRDVDTKTKSQRAVPLNQFVWQLLAKRREEVKGRWVFPNKRDPKRHADVGGLKTAWRTCLKKSGLEKKYRWHDLRATHQSYTHKRTDFTDTQREKFSGSRIDLQKRTYVSFEADDVRGLEQAVQFEGLNDVLAGKLKNRNGETMGKTDLKSKRDNRK